MLERDLKKVAYHKTRVVPGSLVQMLICRIQMIIKAVSDTVEYFIFVPGAQRIVFIGSQLANFCWGHLTSLCAAPRMRMHKKAVEFLLWFLLYTNTPEGR